MIDLPRPDVAPTTRREGGPVRSSDAQLWPPDGYSIDISMRIEVDGGEADTVRHVASIDLGRRFAEAVRFFDLVIDHNLARKEIEYIRLVHRVDGAAIVLSRRTLAGTGDW